MYLDIPLAADPHIFLPLVIVPPEFSKNLGGQKSFWRIWVYKYTIFAVILLFVYLSLFSNLSTKNKL